jgi:DNA ligase 1
MLQDTPDLTSFIMDAEIVAIDPMSGELKSFQELSNRARKDVNIKDIRVAVCIYAFDLMLLNAEVRQPVNVFMIVLNNRTAFTWT